MSTVILQGHMNLLSTLRHCRVNLSSWNLKGLIRTLIGTRNISAVHDLQSSERIRFSNSEPFSISLRQYWAKFILLIWSSSLIRWCIRSLNGKNSHSPARNFHIVAYRTPLSRAAFLKDKVRSSENIFLILSFVSSLIFWRPFLLMWGW